MLINDIIDISMIESNQVRIKYKSFALNGVLTQLKVNFEYQLKQSSSALQLISKPGLPDSNDTVYSDDFRINQILTNLIGNAIKFTQEGKIVFGYTYENKLLTFYVTDTGIGIEPDQQKEIFERFRQADESMTRNYGGTGLGLSICRGLVNLMGGNIWVKSKPAEGSTFFFTIPVNNPRDSNSELTNE
jgi:signal transduction histidine kinase